MNSRLSTTLPLLLGAGVLILASILIYQVVVARPAWFRAQATATAREATATSVARATSTAARATSLAVATQIAMGDLYNQVTSGTPTINDQFRAQDSNNWEDDPPGENSCRFANGSYDVKTAAGRFQPCLAGATNFRNLAFQVEMRIVSGHSGGLIIRSDANGSGYYFRMSTDGTFLGERIVPHNPQASDLTPLMGFAGQSPAVNTGNGQSNQITVIAQGSELYMYVNQQFVARTSDGTYTSGRIGVFTDSDASGAEILFSNAQVWKL